MERPPHRTEPGPIELNREETLRAEIHRFETHLERIATEDDSAYGKARIRMYEALLLERRHQLDALTAAQRSGITSQDYL